MPSSRYHPTFASGGASILYLWQTKRSSYYVDNPLRQRLWAAGHAHAGVLLILLLVALLYLDRANLTPGVQVFVSTAITLSAIMILGAYFLRVVHPGAQRPNALINLAYFGFISLTAGLLVLGFGTLSSLSICPSPGDPSTRLHLQTAGQLAVTRAGDAAS